MGVEDVLRMHVIIDEVYKNLMEWGMIGLQRTVNLRNKSQAPAIFKSYNLHLLPF